ncbi:MAG: hypothetical protein QNL01_10315 [Akkermansiaceae bacterium]|jgi:hypothetical protein|tara:strand:+ start:123 stop:323 length:201 start_codon:yes stop_codon:yes gene_type:complete
MATSLQRNNNRSRPTKSNGARNQRQKVQSRRLVALGMDAATVAAMDPTEVRTLLKHPKKVSAAHQG